MKFHRRRFLHLAGVAAVIAVLSVTVTGHAAWSQTARTIKVVVPVQPGGGADFLARVLGEEIGRAQGPTMVIENRPGAGSIIGTEAVSHAASDGNTLLINSSTLVINPHLRKVNYDPVTSFEPICYLVNAPTVIVVNSASPYRTLANLLDAARAKPGDLTMAGAGPFYLAVEMLKRAANLNMTLVPYPGGAPAVTALLGEHVTSVFTDYPTSAAQLKAGKLRALATGSRTRAEALPDVPTVAESGYKDYDMEQWFGVSAPAKTPKETVSQLVGWFTAALQVPEVKAKLAVQGLYPAGICGADFGAFVRKQYDDYGRAIREANIKPQ
jgi:tripartite-type tricarboxylate transporter receptor subunit TctC